MILEILIFEMLFLEFQDKSNRTMASSIHKLSEKKHKTLQQAIWAISLNLYNILNTFEHDQSHLMTGFKGTFTVI